jgi:hypothetical protein
MLCSHLVLFLMVVQHAHPLLSPGLCLPLGMLNGNGLVCGVGEVLMESMHQESMESAAPPAVSSGGPGPFAFGMNGSAPVPGLVGQGGVEVSTPAAKEQEIFTVASMQIPCRCTNSYAYL